jgi:hypothetical protein
MVQLQRIVSIAHSNELSEQVELPSVIESSREMRTSLLIMRGTVMDLIGVVEAVSSAVPDEFPNSEFNRVEALLRDLVSFVNLTEQLVEDVEEHAK